MVNLKCIAGGAVTGLIISLISGFIGGVGFGTILVRALISALVCGVVAEGAWYVFKRFLDVEVEAAETAAPQRPVSTGTAVNISVGDDPLPDTENAPEFIVTNTDDWHPASEPAHRPEPAKTVIPPAAETTAASVREAEPQFVPSSLGSITSPPRENAPASPGPVSPAPAQPAASADTAFEGLDAMPEIEDIVSSVDEPQEGSPVLTEETSFTEMGSSESSSSSPVPDVTVGSDASLMAQAIRTLLNSEG